MCISKHTYIHTYKHTICMYISIHTCTYIHTYTQHAEHSGGNSKEVGISPENGLLANSYALCRHRPGEATESTTSIHTYIHTVYIYT